MENPESVKKVFITGASGLLGRSLVKSFIESGYLTVGQYHKRKPADISGCKWIRGDFSTREGIKRFLEESRKDLSDCTILINNYGPITFKESVDLSSEDLIHDFFNNVITAKEITDFFLRIGKVDSIVNIGFESAGEIKAYKKILSYAIAKNGLLLLTKSYEKFFPSISFNYISPVSIEGGKFRKRSGKVERADEIAQRIVSLIQKGEKQ